MPTERFWRGMEVNVVSRKEQGEWSMRVGRVFFAMPSASPVDSHEERRYNDYEHSSHLALRSYSSNKMQINAYAR